MGHSDVMAFDEQDPRPQVEHPDDERGRHNRIGYLDVDESSSSSESGDEEPDVADDVDRADD
jgi:hypothetical protein